MGVSILHCWLYFKPVYTLVYLANQLSTRFSTNVQLHNEDKDMLNDIFEKDIVLQPFKRTLQPDRVGGARSSSSLLFLADRGEGSDLTERQWDEAQKYLLEAKTAFERLIKEGQRLLYSIGNANKTDPLWQPLLFGCDWKTHMLHMNNFVVASLRYLRNHIT